MPRARYTADGGHYRVGGEGFDPGQEKTVDRALAEYLDELEDFKVTYENSAEVPDEPTDDSDDEDADEADESDGFDAVGVVDRTPVEDVADDILAGEADEHLDEVGEAADRVTIQDAVGERRAELEG